MSIVILLIIGLTLIFINIKVIKKDSKSSFEEKLNDESYDDNNYKFEIGKIRQEFGETIFELQQEIENLKKEISILKKTNLKSNEKVIFDDNISKRDLQVSSKVNALVDNDVIDEDKEENLKVKEIKKLMQDGLSTDEISQKLNIGKGEVLLIQKLYIK